MCQAPCFALEIQTEIRYLPVFERPGNLSNKQISVQHSKIKPVQTKCSKGTNDRETNSA